MMFVSGSNIFYKLPNGNVTKLKEDEYRHLNMIQRMNYVKELNNWHLSHIQHILDLFDCQNQDFFLDDDLCMQVIMKIPESNLIPGMSFEGKALTNWHHQTLLTAYNLLYNVGYQLSNL